MNFPDILTLFYIDKSTMSKIAADFSDQITQATSGNSSCLQALSSYLTPATGLEKGNYLAIDFGGTNIRVSAVSLQGNGRCSLLTEARRPLRDPNKTYDLTSSDLSGSELFDFVASLVKQVYSQYPARQLGLTFSYPMQQEGVNRARLLRWTKELKPRETVGRNIDTMLMEALARHGLAHLTLQAVINDTVACFLTGSYYNQAVVAGSICGTGHNTCCLHPFSPDEPEVIINLESGNFDRLPRNHYDQMLDLVSDNPGQQYFEKMVSGKYLGELLRLIYMDITEQGVLPQPEGDRFKYPFTIGAEVVGWLHDNPHSKLVWQWTQQAGLTLQPDQLFFLQDISSAIVKRAIHLIAASYLGILSSRLAVNPAPVIAVDGSVFQHMPGFTAGIENLLNSELAGSHPRLLMTPDGSIIGAAVAAARL